MIWVQWFFVYKIGLFFDFVILEHLQLSFIDFFLPLFLLWGFRFLLRWVHCGTVCTQERPVDCLNLFAFINFSWDLFLSWKWRLIFFIYPDFWLAVMFISKIVVFDEFECLCLAIVRVFGDHASFEYAIPFSAFTH